MGPNLRGRQGTMGQVVGGSLAERNRVALVIEHEQVRDFHASARRHDGENARQDSGHAERIRSVGQETVRTGLGDLCDRKGRVGLANRDDLNGQFGHGTTFRVGRVCHDDKLPDP